MHLRTFLILLPALLLSPAWADGARSAAVVHHELSVSVTPASHQLSVRDQLSIPAALVDEQLTLSLNAELKLRPLTGAVRLALLKSRVSGPDVGIDREDHNPEARVPVNVYRVIGARKGQDLRLDLAYEGRINNPVKQLGEEYARGFSQSPGLIEERGIYLAGSTYWVPQVRNERLTYKLQVALPGGWKSVSQGEREPISGTEAAHTEHWTVNTPTEEIYLIAARFTEYSRQAGAVTAQAFLRKPEPALAERYLETTAQYLAMYQGLLGPYPYGKFALVENFWETGYGMPSFTLLGEQIIRFPFIMHSSYPHELLHNWWGNGVFVDFKTGNWCEGLTAYLADHLIAEQRGQGAEHRRDILQRVSDYVTPATDFPLSKFQSRYNAVTEAVGYGKTAMLWNMLRERLGDALFVKGLQRFYREHRFQVAGFDDLRKSFEAVSGQDLTAFFRQWVTQTGTPELQLTSAVASGNALTVSLAQVQRGPRLALDVPVFIQTAVGVERKTLSLTAGQTDVQASFELKGPALRVEVDPQFQVYRRLSPFETPASLSKAFGAKQVLIVTPAAEAARYAPLAKAWRKDGVEVVEDSSLSALPADRPVWVLGAGNKFTPVVAGALKGGSLTSGTLQVGESRYTSEGRSLVAAVRHPQNPASVLVYVSASSEAAATALARKLPHYGKYSWLVFAGDEATNEAKGEWAGSDTPLARDLVPGTPALKLPARKALAELAPVFDGARLKADVDWLAAPERQGRGVGTAGLDAAADHIAARFAALGLTRWDGSGYFQPFSLNGPNGQPVATKNVLGLVPGSNPAYQGQALVVSAHYDHLGSGWPDARAGNQGQLHPGADDNASGVAVLLELARLTAQARPERTVIFAAFSGEEAGLRGARRYVASAREQGARFPLSGHIATLNIDTVGRLEGGKVSIFGASSAREWPFIFMGAQAVTGVPVNVVSKDIDASDHTAFIEAGVPAVQLFASTAADYHRPSDTPEKIDHAGLAKVAAVLKEGVDYLAGRPERLNFTGSTSAAAPPQPAAAAASAPARRAATGLVPDMAFEGEGVRVGSVQPRSGAEQAGMRSGDVVRSIAGLPTNNLRDLADALRGLKPGARVQVEFVRDGQAGRVDLVLGER